MLVRTGRIEVWEKGLGGKNHVDWWLGANVGVTCLLGVVVHWGLLVWESLRRTTQIGVEDPLCLSAFIFLLCHATLPSSSASHPKLSSSP